MYNLYFYIYNFYLYIFICIFFNSFNFEVESEIQSNYALPPLRQ